MASSVRSSVIQGFFVGESLRTAHGSGSQGAPAHRPSSYQELTLQAHQRSSGLAVQSLGNRNTFAVPPHLAGFGRRTGQKLPSAVQQKMESFFGADFSDVQVHSGPEASAIGALAFTHGSNIYFAPGQYNPNSHFGQQLLGHELTHVVQQRAGRVRNPFGSGMAVVQDPALEAEAERMGKQAALFPVLPQTRIGKRFSFTPPGSHLQRAVSSRVAQRAGGGVAPAVVYVLAAAHVKTERQACGGFFYERKFTVNPAPGTDSIIVQEITRTFSDVKQYKAEWSIPLSGGVSKGGKPSAPQWVLKLDPVADPNTINRKANSAATRYWEVFEVKAGSTDAVHTDEFALTTIAKGRKRNSMPLKLKQAVRNNAGASPATEAAISSVYAYTTTGKFVQTGEAIFYENTAVPAAVFKVDPNSPAGLLPSTTVDPAADLAKLNLNHSAPVNITLTATWDSKDKGAEYYGEPNLVIT